MPRELPGFYFDAEKNRYFPSSSKKDGKSRSTTQPRVPAAAPPPNTSEAVAAAASNRCSSSTPPLQARRRSSSPDAWRTLQLSRLASCPRRQRIAAAGTCDGRVWSMAGDSHGVLHAFDPSSSGDFLSMPSHLLQHSWSRVYRLGSHISSIRSSGARWVATSFGSTILTHDIPTNRTVKVSLSPESACDVWTSHLRDRSLVLGARQRALHIQDVESLTDAWRLETYSDVFALHQQEHLVYTGCRNGSIRRFDTRARSPGLILLGQASSNSIAYLNVIRDWQLLVSTIRGAIEIFDLRFLHLHHQETRPLLTLVGNVNSYKHSLPHAITPSQDYFFAAGIDNRIRGWSLLTGELLSHHRPQSTSSPALTLDIPGQHVTALDRDASPFGVQFEEPITSLEITQIAHESCLFATSGSGLHRFILGRRSL
ncbi:hypothetical protein F5148DRAFT_973499 [Russula earlei]|uniref:Uncharacterized protein n=1 Tax=Russula earlei TaxID=71964 RepID=A0ACC0UL58_9AGAM|nr:hypothetical protein F5148DRAFT_973499 [Russula earlei]